MCRLYSSHKKRLFQRIFPLFFLCDNHSNMLRFQRTHYRIIKKFGEICERDWCEWIEACFSFHKEAVDAWQSKMILHIRLRSKSICRLRRTLFVHLESSSKQTIVGDIRAKLCRDTIHTSNMYNNSYHVFILFAELRNAGARQQKYNHLQSNAGAAFDPTTNGRQFAESEQS